MNKKTIVILSLSLLTFPLFSQVQWKELDTRDGLVYAPGYTGDPMSDKNPAFDNPDFKQSISKYDPTTVGGSKKIREAKQQLINQSAVTDTSIIENPYTGSVSDSYDDGNPRIEGTYKNGLMDGIWTYYYPDGVTKAEGQFLKGDGGNMNELSGIPQNGRYGEWTIYYPNGNVNAKYQFDVHGKFNQDRLEWYDNGNKKIEMHYVNGIPEGPWLEWYENGQKKRHYFHKEGKRDQTWTVWWSNGNIKTEGNFKEGLKNGQFTFWFQNGQKKFEGVCRNDKLFGEWTFYNADGSVEKIKEYTN